LELYSLTVKLYKHQTTQFTSHQPATTVAGVTGGIANFAMSKRKIVCARVHVCSPNPFFIFYMLGELNFSTFVSIINRKCVVNME